MKVAMIAPVGKSPSVITEMARFLESEYLSDVILLPTKDEFVLAGTRLVEAALKVHYPKLRIHVHVLPKNDIASEEDALLAAKEITKAICIEKFKIGTDRIFLNVAGGRKEVTVMAALLGSMFGVTGIYHVVNKDIEVFNEYQQQIMEDIMKFSEKDLDKRIEMYKEQQEKFDKLLFPDGSKLEFINIPVIPYSPEDIARLKRILKPRGVSLVEEPMEPYLIQIYQQANLIVYNKQTSWIHPTDMGLEIGKILRCEV